MARGWGAKGEDNETNSSLIPTLDFSSHDYFSVLTALLGFHHRQLAAWYMPISGSSEDEFCVVRILWVRDSVCGTVKQRVIT